MGGLLRAHLELRQSTRSIYAESFKDEAHLDAIVSEAHEIVDTALASSGPN